MELERVNMYSTEAQKGIHDNTPSQLQHSKVRKHGFSHDSAQALTVGRQEYLAPKRSKGEQTRPSNRKLGQ
eukprot:1136216-Amphidinium_carterae.1